MRNFIKQRFELLTLIMCVFFILAACDSDDVIKTPDSSEVSEPIVETGSDEQLDTDVIPKNFDSPFSMNCYVIDRNHGSKVNFGPMDSYKIDGNIYVNVKDLVNSIHGLTFEDNRLVYRVETLDGNYRVDIEGIEGMETITVVNDSTGEETTNTCDLLGVKEGEIYVSFIEILKEANLLDYEDKYKKIMSSKYPINKITIDQVIECDLSEAFLFAEDEQVYIDKEDLHLLDIKEETLMKIFGDEIYHQVDEYTFVPIDTLLNHIYGATEVSLEEKILNGKTNIEYNVISDQSMLMDYDELSRMEIHIIASKEDMENGVFHVEFQEPMSGFEQRVMIIGERNGLIPSSDWIEPYVYGEDDSFKVYEDEHRIEYDIRAYDTAAYGFTVHPKRNNLDTGFVTSDFGVFPGVNFLDGGIINFDGQLVRIVFDVPTDYTVIAPWTPDSYRENAYIIDTSYDSHDLVDEIIVVSTAYWGDFDHIYEDSFENNKVKIFTYNEEEMPIDASKPVEDLIIAYKEYMRGFSEVTDTYFSHTLVAGFVNPGLIYDSNLDYHVWDGIRGNYLAEIHSDYNFVGDAHGISHWVDPILFKGRWMGEGIAEYNRIIIESKYTQSNNELNRLKEDIKYYHDFIVPYGYDLPLALIKVDDFYAYEKEYPISIQFWADYTIHDHLFLLQDYNSSFDIETRFRKNDWFLYRKSCIIMYILNDLITSGSSSTYDLYDIFNYYSYSMVHEDWADSEIPINYESPMEVYSEIEKEIERMSGYHVEGFFSDYLFGTEILPIYVNDGQIIVDYSVFQ